MANKKRDSHPPEESLIRGPAFTLPHFIPIWAGTVPKEQWPKVSPLVLARIAATLPAGDEAARARSASLLVWECTRAAHEAEKEKAAIEARHSAEQERAKLREKVIGKGWEKEPEPMPHARFLARLDLAPLQVKRRLIKGEKLWLAFLDSEHFAPLLPNSGSDSPPAFAKRVSRDGWPFVAFAELVARRFFYWRKATANANRPKFAAGKANPRSKS